MRLQIQITFDKPPGLGKRKWNEWNRSALAKSGQLYEDQFKPRHFESGASSRYGYQPRSAKYQTNKAKAVDRGSWHISPDAKNDLIYSGLLRRQIKRPHIIKAFPTRVRIDMATAQYAQMRPYQSGRPNLGAEITAVAADELLLVQATMKTTVESAFNAWSQPQTKSIP